MSNYKVLISDPLPSDAKEILEATGKIDVVEGFDKIEESLSTIHGWIVRSGTQITADYLERAPQLKCVCRAGAGVDNIDIAAAKGDRGGLAVAERGADSELDRKRRGPVRESDRFGIRARDIHA